MIADMHVHTRWSSDSTTPVAEQVERAIELGMESICITDHQDFDAPRFPRTILRFSSTTEAMMRQFLHMLQI